MMLFPRRFSHFLALAVALSRITQASSLKKATPDAPADWRRDQRIIDLHQHVNGTEATLSRWLKIMDRVGVGIGVNLCGGTVTAKPGEISAFQNTQKLADRLAPGRSLLYFNLDYAAWDNPDFSERAVKQVERAKELGAAGLKEYKRLGLFLRDSKGELIKIDDPKLDPIWKRCGELGLPISIHVADPRAFWLPYSVQIERWTELKDHKSWWFGDSKQFPSRETLLNDLDRVIARHRQTTFVCAHFANNAEDIDWVDRKLDQHPNMNADLAARIPELGRHDPEKLRHLFIKHQDRIFFATDFQMYDKLILGSSGDAERPTDEDALDFYRKEWRWLETKDHNWPHMTPIQGKWNISSIGLPESVLRKIYFDNARKLLVRSMPFATLRAKHITRDFQPNGTLDASEWASAPLFRLEQECVDGKVHTEVSTSVRLLWSDRFLYLSFQCPFTVLTDFGPAKSGERVHKEGSLWDKDVVEFFCAPDTNHLRRYTEFEWAPNNEALDLVLRDGSSDFIWSSKMEWTVKVDPVAKIWRCEARIPLKALSETSPSVGSRWRANFYRLDRSSKSALASNPVLNGSFHTPDRFGWLEFIR
ncbi:MAG: hypothetical protein EXS25_07345 [Pedosphaera sp.]|nr:hypothetical protein [Pedosphaera sp.]